MIRALLIIWSMDPTGAGSVAIAEMPSMAACYSEAGRAVLAGDTFGLKYACEPFGDVSRRLAANRCTPTADARVYVCRGRP